MTKSPEAGARIPTLVEDDPSVNKDRSPEPSNETDVQHDAVPTGRPNDDRVKTETAQGDSSNGVPADRT